VNKAKLGNSRAMNLPGFSKLLFNSPSKIICLVLVKNIQLQATSMIALHSNCYQFSNSGVQLHKHKILPLYITNRVE